MDGRGLDPTHCPVIRVSGESTEPPLPDGCSILIDRNRRQRLDNRLFVVRTGDGLVVKRAERGAGWQLLNDQPGLATRPRPADAKTIGQAMWMAWSLV